MAISESEKLTRLAMWYRDQAERAGEPRIWEARLLMAEDLEAQARAARTAAGETPPSAE
jgi:hypothetical protein